MDIIDKIDNILSEEKVKSKKQITDEIKALDSDIVSVSFKGEQVHAKYKNPDSKNFAIRKGFSQQVGNYHDLAKQGKIIKTDDGFEGE